MCVWCGFGGVGFPLQCQIEETEENQIAKQPKTIYNILFRHSNMPCFEIMGTVTTRITGGGLEEMETVFNQIKVLVSHSL